MGAVRLAQPPRETPERDRVVPPTHADTGDPRRGDKHAHAKEGGGRVLVCDAVVPSEGRAAERRTADEAGDESYGHDETVE